MPDSAPPTPEQIDLATAWFLAARAMLVASGRTPRTNEAAGGLYAQAVLGLSEDCCLEAKAPERIARKTLVDCLATVGRLSRDEAEKVVTGVMMIAYGDRSMHPLEVRWASMLASAADLSPDDFQRCCASAGVISAMLRPAREEAEA